MGLKTRSIATKAVLSALFALSVCFFGTARGVALAESPKENTCIGCHSDTADEWKPSVHAQQGVSCQNCHGGDATKDDMEAAHAKEAGFIGVPDKKQIAQTCGGCHANVEVMNFYGTRTDQLAQYKTSHHGKKLFLEGNTKVAVCSDCHSNHNVVRVTDPNSPVYPANLPKTCNKCHGNEKLMTEAGLPSDIFKKYSASVHGKALFEKHDMSVANCASCHGSHGAMPPGVKDVATTCGKCHINEKKYFLESIHATAQEQGKFSECISCHGNHDVEPVSPALYEKACVKCHEAGSSQAQFGLNFERLITDAQTKYDAAGAEIKQASIEGYFVEPEQAQLEEMKTNVIGLAPLQHTLSVSKLSELHKKVEDASNTIHSEIMKKRDGLKRRKLILVVIWVLIIIMIRALWAEYKRLKAGHGKEHGKH